MELNTPTMAFTEPINPFCLLRGRSIAGVLMTASHFIFAFHFG